jgi:hypothetical protein
MKRLMMILVLSATVLFCGCGGGSRLAPGVSTPALLTPPASQEPVPTVSRNWEFTASPGRPGELPLTFEGSIGWAGPAISATLHVEGSNCFDQRATLVFPATVVAGTTALISQAIDGQVVTISGNFSDPFTGTYKIDGGCAAGYHGNLTGFSVWDIGSDIGGVFTSSVQTSFKMAGKVTQGSTVSSDGSFPVNGTVTFDTPCFQSGIIQPGTFPSGSVVLGMSLVLEVETTSGILTFVGNRDEGGGGRVNGNYSVSGGACDESGTAVLQVLGKWDY